MRSVVTQIQNSYAPRRSTVRPCPLATLERLAAGSTAFLQVGAFETDCLLAAVLEREPEPRGRPGPRVLFATFFAAPEPRGRPGPRRGGVMLPSPGAESGESDRRLPVINPKWHS